MGRKGTGSGDPGNEGKLTGQIRVKLRGQRAYIIGGHGKVKTRINPVLAIKHINRGKCRC